MQFDRLQRREFIALLGGSVAWPLAARAQQSRRTWRIGFLAGGSRPTALQSSSYGAFSRGMGELGYIEGRDFIIEWRFAEGRFELFPELAAELVQLNVDVIVLGSPQAIPAAQRATSTIPIVMGTSTDPVGSGYVSSLARPGGNITGLASSQDDYAPKQLELLTLLVPGLTRVAFLVNPNASIHRVVFRVALGAAQKTGLTLVPVELGTRDGIDNAFAKLSKEGVGAMVATGDALFFSLRNRIAELALKARLPTVFAQREYVEAGALMSYGESLADLYRRATFYVDKILKGASPSDLPIQQPTRFFLVINRKTAETLGLSIPLQLLVLADQVIE
jgi:putative tryptophan/tyrosine transport system substrate-binding protein